MNADVEIRLEPSDLEDPVIRSWWAKILRRRLYRRAERIMQQLRADQRCSTREAVELTAERLGRSESWVRKALARLQRAPRKKRRGQG